MRLTFRKPLAPDGAGWAPWVGQGSWQAGLSLPPPGRASRHTRARIVPTEVPGQKTQVATVCLCSRVWAEALVTARQQWRAGWQLPHPSLDPSPASAGGRDGRQRPQAATCSLCDSSPVTSHGAPCPLGPPLAFQGPAIPQGALTWDHRGRGRHLPTLLLCREGNRGPEMTFAEFTGPSGKMVRDVDCDASQAPVQPPALLFSCCVTLCK